MKFRRVFSVISTLVLSTAVASNGQNLGKSRLTSLKDFFFLLNNANRMKLAA